MSDNLTFREKTYQMIYEEFSTVLDRIDEVKRGLPDATGTAIEDIDAATKKTLSTVADKFSALKTELEESFYSLHDFHEEFLIDVDKHIRQCEERLGNPIDSYMQILANTDKLVEMLIDEIDRYAAQTSTRLGAAVRVEASHAVIAAGKAGVEAEVMPVLHELQQDLNNSLQLLDHLVNYSRNEIETSAQLLQETAQAATQALSERISKLLTKSNLKLGAIAASVVFLIGLGLGASITVYSLQAYQQHSENTTAVEAESPAE